MTTIEQTDLEGVDSTPAPAPAQRSYSRHRNGPFFWVGVVLLSIIFVAPLLWMFLTSVRTRTDAMSVPVTPFPSEITFRAYQVIFGESQNPVLIWALNSLVAATLHAALVLAQKPGEEVTQTAHGSSLPRSGSGKRSSASRMSATMRRQPVRTKSPSWASVMPASRG